MVIFLNGHERSVSRLTGLDFKIELKGSNLDEAVCYLYKIGNLVSANFPLGGRAPIKEKTPENNRIPRHPPAKEILKLAAISPILRPMFKRTKKGA